MEDERFKTSIGEILSVTNKAALGKLNIRAQVAASLERYNWMDEPIAKINALIEAGDAAKMPGYAYWRLTYRPLMHDHVRILGVDEDILGDFDKENFIPICGEVWTSKAILKECYFRLLAYLGTYTPNLHDLCIVRKKDFDELVCEKYTFQEFDNHHMDFNIVDEVEVPGGGRELNYREWNWLRKKKEAFSRKRCFNGRNYPGSSFILDENLKVVGMQFGDSKVEISEDPSILEDWL